MTVASLHDEGHTMSTEFIEKPDPALDPKRFAPLRVRQLMPHFGAEIDGVDLTLDLPAGTRALLRDAWLTYGVVILTGQKPLGPAEHLRAVSIFGEPDVDGHFIEKPATPIEVFANDESRPPVTNMWHADNTNRAVPSIGTMIQVQDCPPLGGNTSWASTRKAYRCLSEPMKGYLEGLIAVHHWDGRARPRVRLPAPHLDDRPQSEANSEDQPDQPATQPNAPHPHPVVATHPITGEKTLYVNETYTIFIEGLHQYESRAILNFLYSWIRMPEFYVTHNWAPNDVAIWDNYAMQHYALADYAQPRLARRVTFGAHG
jgi:taurine dioxygenase